MSKVPRSKRKLRKKYRIPNKDFQIIATSSEPKEEPGTWLERVVSWKEALPTFLRRRGLRVVAVIVVLPIVKHEITEGIEIYAHAAKAAKAWFEPFSKLPKPDPYSWPKHVALTAGTSNAYVTSSISIVSWPPGGTG